LSPIFLLAFITNAVAFTVARFDFQGNSYFSDKELSALTKTPGYSFADSAEFKDKLKLILRKYTEAGFYFASIDSVLFTVLADSTMDAVLFLTEGAALILTDATIAVSDATGASARKPYFPNGWKFSADSFNSAIEQTLSAVENRGYPFVQLRLTDMQMCQGRDSDELSAAFALETGPQVKISGVEVRGNQAVKSPFIVRESRLKISQLFTPKAFASAQKYLRNTSLFETVSPVGFSRRGDEYKAVLSVKEKHHNSIDGAIGYIPSSNSGKGYWTGLIDLAFGNLFGSGRRFILHWQQPYRNSQDLSLQYREPWIGGLPVDMSLAFAQSLRATSYYTDASGDDRFLTRSLDISAHYALAENLSVSSGLIHAEVIPDSAAHYSSGIPHSLSWGGNWN